MKEAIELSNFKFDPGVYKKRQSLWEFFDEIIKDHPEMKPFIQGEI